MAPRVMAPCGFLAGGLSCVGVKETEEDGGGGDVYECRGLIERNNNLIGGGEDKSGVLMPHDLYQSIDYSINISTSPADVYNDLPTDLYASVLPKSKRLLANNALECLEDQVKSNVDIDVDDNCKWNLKDVELPRETQHIKQSIRHESESAREPSYICIQSEGWRRATETGQTYRLSSNSGAPSQITAQSDRYQTQFHKHEKLLRRLSVLHSLKQRPREDTEKKKKKKKRSVSPSLQLPPVCGRSPPCDCPEDQLYAAKLRLRILKKISTLRQRHIRLRVIR